MFVTSAYAQTAAAATSPIIADVLQFAPLVLMGLVFYFLLLRPQQQQAKQLKATLSALRRGDKVVTGSGAAVHCGESEVIWWRWLAGGRGSRIL